MGEKAYGEQFEFTFTRERLEAYKAGAIHPRWFEHYPQLFDEDDRRIVENQHSHGYHFFEMLSAILLYESAGYLSLLEKYSTRGHKRKREKLVEIVPHNLLALFGTTAGEPDLFCFQPETGEWFLAEVKGNNDRLSQNQIDWAQIFVDSGGPPVRIMLLKCLASA